MCLHMQTISLYCHHPGQACKSLSRYAKNMLCQRTSSSMLKKTVCMVFNPQRPYTSTHLYGSQSPIVTLDGNMLTWVEQFKYLGHVLDCNLSDTADMRRIKRSLYYTVNMLCALVGRANNDILIRLFQSYCTNFYGCELWDTMRDRKALRELCVAYHSCVKKLVGVPKSFRNHPLCFSLNILTCPMLIASRQLLFHKRLLSSENEIIKTVLVSDIGRSGITAGVHIAIRREYGLMAMDLSSANCASIKNTFTGHLKRLISDR